MFHASFNRPHREVSYTLIITFPDGAVHSFPVGDAAITIGRSPATAIRVPEDGVSRQHCVISLGSDRLIVLDQGSTNGTFVNGALVKQARLNDGDVVQVGSTRIRVEVRDTDDSEPVQRPTTPTGQVADDEADTLTFELTGHTQVLQRLTERLAGSEGAASAAELVLDAVFEIFPVDRAYILTRRRERSGAVPEIVAFQSRTLANDSGEMNVEVPKIVLETLLSDPNLTEASEATSAVRAAMSERSSNPVLCSPLRQGGETFGALYLDALTLPVWAHSSEMLEFLTSVGALTALAMTRARLQAELTLERQMSQHGRGGSTDTDSHHLSVIESREESTTPAEELRRLQKVNVNVTKGLLKTVSSHFSSLDETLTSIGKKQDEGSDEAAAFLKAMACARRIVSAVEDVSKLAEFEAGALVKRKRRSVVAKLFERAMRSCQSRAEEEGISLSTGKVDDDLEVLVEADIVNRVLERLIFEALTHTPQGGRVILSGRHRAATVELIVADSGKGEPKKRREAVFTGESSSTKGRGSMAMYYCRKAVEAMGGAIRVTGPTGNNQVILSLPGD